jgi:hypothetical protein
VIGHVRISIAVFSYDGGLYFGVTGDYDSSRDIDILTSGIERSMAELLRRLGSPAKDRTPAEPEKVRIARERPQAAPARDSDASV